MPEIKRDFRWLFVQAATVATFSKMTVEDSRKLLPGDLYPSWVVFTTQQKVYFVRTLYLALLHAAGG